MAPATSWGETLHFYVSNFSLYTGVTEDDMTITHKLSSIDKTSMSLRDIRDGQDVVYKFSRVGEWTLPEVTVETTSAPEEESVVETTPAPETETARGGNARSRGGERRGCGDSAPDGGCE